MGGLTRAVRDDLRRLLLCPVVQGGDAGMALAQLARTVGAVVEAALDEVGERGDGERGVGLHGERGGVEAAVVRRPAADGELAERHVDQLRAWRQQVLQLAGAVVLAGERLLKVVHVEREDDVGLLQQLPLGRRCVERVARREVVEVAPGDDGKREQFREPHEAARRLLRASKEVGEDDRALRLDEQPCGQVERVRVGLEARRLREGVEVRHLERLGELLLLGRDVEVDVDRALRLAGGDVVGADERLDRRADAGRLVVPLHVVADGVALHVGGVYPLDPRSALVGGHGAGAAEHEDGGAVRRGVEDGHRCVEQADDVVHVGRHRLARGLAVTVRDGDRDLLVRAEDELRALVAEVVDERVVDAAEAGAGVHGDVLDAEAAQRLDDDVGAPLGLADW